MSLESQVEALVTSTTQLLDAVNEKKSVLDAAAADASDSADAAEASKVAAGISADAAATSAGDAATSAAGIASLVDEATAASGVAVAAATDAASSASAAAGSAAAAGEASRLTVGTVTTVEYPEEASVSITGSPGAQAVNFTLPRGPSGDLAGAVLASTLKAVPDDADIFGYLDANSEEFVHLTWADILDLTAFDPANPGAIGGTVPAPFVATNELRIAPVGGRSILRATVNPGTWDAGSLYFDTQSVPNRYSHRFAYDGSIVVAGSGGLFMSASSTVEDIIDTGMWRKTAGVMVFSYGSWPYSPNGTLRAGSYYSYNSYTDESNYERGALRWSSNVLDFGWEAAGTGSSSRSMRLGPLGGSPLTVSQYGGLYVTAHNNSGAFLGLHNGSTGMTEVSYNSGLRWFVNDVNVADWSSSLLTFKKALRVDVGSAGSSYSMAFEDVGAATSLVSYSNNSAAATLSNGCLYYSYPGATVGIKFFSYSGRTGSFLWQSTQEGFINQMGRSGSGWNIPQGYNLFNIYTDDSNYERGFIRWSNNTLQIGAEVAGVYTTKRNVDFVVPGTDGSGAVGAIRVWYSPDRYMRIYYNYTQGFTIENPITQLVLAGAVGTVVGGGSNVSQAAAWMFESAGLVTLGRDCSNAGLQFGPKVSDSAAQTFTITGHAAYSTATTHLVGGNIVFVGGAGAASSSGAAHGGHIKFAGGPAYGTGTKGRVILDAPNAAPQDSFLSNGELTMYLDQATNKVMVRVKYSDGTLKTGEVALA